MKEIERYYDSNGNVLVLFSPGFGAGWSSWNENSKKEFMMFDKHLVELVLSNKTEDISAYVESIFGEDYVCTLGAKTLRCYAVPKGCLVRIKEYDGSESVEIFGEDNYFKA